MVGVVFVFVSEDACEAETLADAFDGAGYSITGTHAIGDALSIVLWSRAALRSSLFCSAAERALNSGRAIVVSLIAPPDPGRVLGAPVVDLSAWEGDDGEALEPLFDAVRDVLFPEGAVALPALEYEDAEFVEHVEHAAPRLSQAERVELAMRAWEAPIPTEMLHPPRHVPPREEALVPDEALELADIVRAAPERAPKPRRATEAELIAEGMARIAAELAGAAPDEAPKRPRVRHPPVAEIPPLVAAEVHEPEPPPKRKAGVASPRHDYRRAPQRRSRASPAPAAIAFMFVVLVGLSAYTTRLNVPAQSAPLDPSHDGAMSLTTVTAGAAELQDFAPEERPPLFDPAPYAEPASAPVRRSARRARRAAPEDLSHAAYVPQPETAETAAAPDDSVWQVPQLIPEAIVAELERASSAASDAATAMTDAASAVAQPLAELSAN